MNNQEMTDRARDLRKEPTDAEQQLWYRLRNRRLNGFKFHRQYVMGQYIVDLICLEKKIVVEVDGGQHAEKVKYDENRTAYLNTRGFQVLRYWNNDVLERTDAVLEDILGRLELGGRV